LKVHERLSHIAQHHGFHQCIKGPVYLHPALVVEWGSPVAPILRTCPDSFNRPPPHYAALDLLAEATRLYGTEGRFPKPFWLWPSPTLHVPGTPMNVSVYFQQKLARMKEAKRLKACGGSKAGICLGDQGHAKSDRLRHTASGGVRRDKSSLISSPPRSDSFWKRLLHRQP
jgi:hypothetical protein